MSLSEKKKKRLLTLIIVLSLILMGLVTWLVGKPLVQFAKDPNGFRAWVDTHGIWGRVLYVGMVIFLVLVALIPGEPLEIAGGYAFGAWEGTLLCLLGATLGSTLVFLVVRRWGVRVLELYFPREKIESLRFMQNTPKVRVVAFLLMFIPGTPKDLISYCMGLTKIRLSEWIILSTVARIPSIVTSTVGGDAPGRAGLPLRHSGLHHHSGHQSPGWAYLQRLHQAPQSQIRPPEKRTGKHLTRRDLRWSMRTFCFLSAVWPWPPG